MKLTCRLTLIALSLLFAGRASACQPPIPTPGFAKIFKNVVIGTIASPGFVQHMPNAGPELLFKIQRIQILSGTAPATITAVAPCGIPYQVGERVVVGTYMGRRSVYPADMYEESFRTAHRGER